MQQSIGKRKVWCRTGAVKCGWIALAVFLSAFLPYIIFTGGFFTLAEDYNQQQIPFLAAAVQGLKALPSGEWVWNLDLGSSLITGLGYYNLGSPFTWLALPFPQEIIPYLAVWLILLKYVTAAVTAYLWLKQFVKEENAAVFGGILYAFSGFQSTNLLFHFHDITAFFPLMLLGLDRLEEEKKGLLFSFSVMINCLTNYFFFVQEVIFTVVYFLFRYTKKGHLADLIKQGFISFFYAAVGVMLAAPLFLPHVIYLLGSPRVSPQLSWDQLLYDLKSSLFILKGFLFPGEAMREQSAIFESDFGSTSAYVPFFGLSFVVVWLAENRGWLKRLLIALILVSFSPLIQAGFLLFTATYQRWWYMLNLLFVLATVQVFDRRQFQTPRGLRLLGCYAGVVALFCAALWKAPWDPEGTLVIKKDLFFLYAGIALVSSLLCFGLARWKKLNVRCATVWVALACAVTTGATVGVYRRSTEYDHTQRDYLIGTALTTVDEQYRYREVKNLYTFPGHGAGVGSFTSTKENSTFEFLTVFISKPDFNAVKINDSGLLKSIPGLPELLGGKYTITKKPDGRVLKKPITVNGSEWWITERDACPIGFATDSFISLEELKKFNAKERAYVLMSAVVVKDPDPVSSYRERRWGEEDLLREPADLIRRAEENRVLNFRRDGRGFSCATDFDQDRLVFFSVPNDAGWTARIDREEARIIDSCGMMTLDVPRGSHEISFSYRTPGLRPGIVLSAIGWVISGVLYLLKRRVRKPADH